MKAVIEMAKKCGIPEFENNESQAENIMRFAELIRADERERIIAANAPEIERCNTHIKALEDSHRFLEEIEAEWQRRCDTVKKEANYWHKRHDAVMDSVMKTSFFHAHPPFTLMAEPESFNAGKALAERQMMQLFTDPENQPKQHGTVTVEYMQREIAAQSKDLAALREFAAGRCTIQKVIDELGPMSLWSYAAMERRLDEVRVEEREACAKVCEELAEKEWADNERCAAAIRARGQV